MKTRTIAIVTSIATLSFAAAPIASAASTHAVSKGGRIQQMRDTRTDHRGAERSRDTSSVDRSHEPSSADRSHEPSSIDLAVDR